MRYIIYIITLHSILRVKGDYWGNIRKEEADVVHEHEVDDLNAFRPSELGGNIKTLIISRWEHRLQKRQNIFIAFKRVLRWC